MSTGTPRTTTFTLPQLELIRQALTELGRTPQPFGYAVGKNLRIVSRILDAAQEIGRDFMKTMSESNSIPIVVRNGGADGPIIRPYVTGEPLAADEGAYYDMNPEQRNVVNAFTFFLNSLGNGAFRRGRFE